MLSYVEKLSIAAVLMVLFTVPTGPTAAGEVRLSVTEPSGVVRSNWPLTSGIPLSRGRLSHPEHVSLISPAGEEIPVQTEALSRWPDGSVRWLLTDFQTSLQAGSTVKYRLRYGAGIHPAPVADPVRATENQAGIRLETGPLRIDLSRTSFRLLDAVWLDRNRDGVFDSDERMTSSSDAGIVLTVPGGRQFRADLVNAQMQIEQAGPLRACVRISGHHGSADGRMFRYIVRLHVFRGQPFVKLCYTFLNDHPTDLMTAVESIDLVFPHRSEDTDQRSFLLDHQASDAATLYQVDDRSYEVNGRVAGRRAAGWAATGDQQGGLAVGVRDFWQNWPKSLTVGSQLRVGICPDFESGRYDGKPIKEESQLYYCLREGQYSFKVGVSRTHELWATFFDGSPRTERLNDFYRAADQPLLAQLTPDDVYLTRAAGRIVPAKNNSSYTRYDIWLGQLFGQHLDDIENIREYGLLNYGDWYNIKWDSWGNLEYDTARCFFHPIPANRRPEIF